MRKETWFVSARAHSHALHEPVEVCKHRHPSAGRAQACADRRNEECKDNRHYGVYERLPLGLRLVVKGH